MESNKYNCDWVCYLLYNTDANTTYIGSTNNLENRLNTHNRGAGAKYTKGKQWQIALYITGFESKISCLSFESGWKKISKKRSNDRFIYDYIIDNMELTYGKDSILNRVLDLLFFVRSTTYLNKKYKKNLDLKFDMNISPILTINNYDLSLEKLAWPFFILID